MHRFLRAIGFQRQLGRQDVDQLLGYVMNEPHHRKKIDTEEGVYTEITRDFGHYMGVTIRGKYDKLGFFHVEHYFPYCSCNLFTATEDIVVNKRVDTDAYTGMCDDMRLGISMIFYLQNVVDYLELNTPDNTPHKAKLSLSGLSLQGTILLGVEHSDQFIRRKNQDNRIRTQLIQQAKNGDQDAIDSLTIDEIDLSSRIRNRIKSEDLYSLVDTSFIPYGSESDNYMIIATILNWTLEVNSYTHEEVYRMLLKCNDIVLTVCINRNDLSGTPVIGCRFKGVIWMQGFVDFQKLNSGGEC
ncbi:MAG: DUF3881 family protein [Lachnospiraceae bacterium]|nr:DUF3881 family protein [Lachnospiraceae bacterium]